MDKDASKLDALASELKRMGIESVQTVQADMEKTEFKDSFGPFHRILVDAPCSGLGVLRRNPDAKWSINESDLIRNQNRQVLFLSQLAERVMPNGILVYAVCSTEPEETELVIRVFLDHRPDFVVEAISGSMVNNIINLMDAKGYMFTNPLHHDMDGFFAARLRRKMA